MRKFKVLSMVLVIITVCFLFSGCQSEKTKIVDEKILALSQKEI